MSDSVLRKAAGAAVLLVAAIAATVSFLHIYRLSLALGQPQLAACLMPLSVDGTIGAASAALLSAARSGGSSPVMARLRLALGVAATLTANAYSGSAHGIAGMALAMWPGVAFIGSTETALSMVRRSARSTAEAVATPVSISDMTAVSRPAISLAWPRPVMSASLRPSASAKRPAKPAKADRRAAAIVRRHPDISGAEFGRKLGLSERSGRRILATVTEGAAA